MESKLSMMVIKNVVVSSESHFSWKNSHKSISYAVMLSTSRYLLHKKAILISIYKSHNIWSQIHQKHAKNTYILEIYYATYVCNDDDPKNMTLQFSLPHPTLEKKYLIFQKCMTIRQCWHTAFFGTFCIPRREIVYEITQE